MPTHHLIIKGKVQGVFYRASAKKEADRLGITGWVQNTEEDSVEIIASGSETALKSFIEWCRKGPSRASVTDIEITEKEEERFTDFKINR